MEERADREFVKAHEPLVRKLASRIRAELDLIVELDDLVSYGFGGLLEARERFDPTRGVLFTSYAHYRIRGAILDGVRQMARLPRRAHDLRKAAEALDLAAESAGEERAARSGAKPDVGATLASIDDILGQYSAAFVISALGQAERAPRSPENEAHAGEQRGRVSEALECLPERERLVIEGFYFEDRSLEELGSSLGISKSWCSRLHTRGLGMLRDALGPKE